MEIRDATKDDVAFLSWVELTAARSHLPRGPWEYIYDFSEEQTLDFLRRLLVTETVHWCHWSRFLIAEVDGKPAAALCGFDPDVHGTNALMSVMPQLSEGVAFDDAFMRRVGAQAAVSPDYEPGAWVTENVATLPEYRRRGLVDRLLEANLERGRAQGFNTAQIAVFIGNEPARKAYLKQGFEYKDEKRDRTFEADMGCPGMERLLRPL
jgi:ribosomal protein S18 acetylase RimI-like enzyme